jgi:hypothetical protein
VFHIVVSDEHGKVIESIDTDSYVVAYPDPEHEGKFTARASIDIMKNFGPTIMKAVGSKLGNIFTGRG